MSPLSAPQKDFHFSLLCGNCALLRIKGFHRHCYFIELKTIQTILRLDLNVLCGYAFFQNWKEFFEKFKKSLERFRATLNFMEFRLAACLSKNKKEHVYHNFITKRGSSISFLSFRLRVSLTGCKLVMVTYYAMIWFESLVIHHLIKSGIVCQSVNCWKVTETGYPDPRVFLDFSLLLVFHRMRELRESREEVNTSGFATRIRRFAKRRKSLEKPLGCTNVVFDVIACNFYFI